jgi:hypothetical protein
MSLLRNCATPWLIIGSGNTTRYFDMMTHSYYAL